VSRKRFALRVKTRILLLIVASNVSSANIGLFASDFDFYAAGVTLEGTEIKITADLTLKSVH